MEHAKSKCSYLHNLQLKISALLILIIGLTYGVNPADTLPRLFDFNVQTNDLKNIFRSIMGLYLAMSFIWLFGIVNPKFWVTATITNIFFMGGLALGRLTSLIIDGFPGIYFSIGFVVELILSVWAIINLNRHIKSSTS